MTLEALVLLVIPFALAATGVVTLLITRWQRKRVLAHLHESHPAE